MNVFDRNLKIVSRCKAVRIETVIYVPAIVPAKNKVAVAVTKCIEINTVLNDEKREVVFEYPKLPLGCTTKTHFSSCQK